MTARVVSFRNINIIDLGFSPQENEAVTIALILPILHPVDELEPCACRFFDHSLRRDSAPLAARRDVAGDDVGYDLSGGDAKEPSDLLEARSEVPGFRSFPLALIERGQAKVEIPFLSVLLRFRDGRRGKELRLGEIAALVYRLGGSCIYSRSVACAWPA